MKKNKSTLQKSALYFAGASFIASVGSVIFLLLKLDTVGWESPVSASLLASSFFFAFVGLVLVVIGTADIPSFKIGSDSD